MKTDPIVAEVRKARAEIVRECGNDLSRLFERLRRNEQGKQLRTTRTPKRKARVPIR